MRAGLLLLYNFLMDASLKPFFHPHGVVIVGASTDPTKLGWSIARNMVRSGFGGAIHFVNIKGGELFGRPIYRSLREVPDPVDLAVMILPAAITAEALADAAVRGIRAVIVSSAGFREIGPEGAELERNCLKICKKNQMRLIGPNCVGLIDYHLPMDTSFITLPPAPKGDLALISQSGAVCGLIMDWAQERGFGFSRLLSLGNQADVNETDMLAGVAEDEKTKVITFYMESIQDGRRFVEEAKKASSQKPLITLKVGNSNSGRKAAASHTGALAGTAVAYEAAFRRAGILQAESIEEMFNWAIALAACPLPKGRRIAILTNAGGPGVIAADALERHQLSLAELSPTTLSRLAAILPQAASLHNPVDILGSGTHEMYAGSLQLLLDDTNVDGVVVILPPPPVDTAVMDAEVMIPLIRASSKPVVVALTGGKEIREAAKLFRKANIPEYRFVEGAISAMAALVQRKVFLEKTVENPLPLKHIDAKKARMSLKGNQPGSLLGPEAAEQITAAYGIPSAPAKLARTEIEAGRIAEQLGFPVALKIVSAEIPHKSEAGGVLLNIQTCEETRHGFRIVIENSRMTNPQAHIEGVLVQKMINDGQEVIIGASRDPQFGPLMMFGSGGVEVEGLNDVAFALAPLCSDEVDYLIQRTWAGRKLAGYRNIGAADVESVKDILQRLGQLAVDLPEISEIEINPLTVMAPGQGAVAVDVRVRLTNNHEPVSGYIDHRLLAPDP